MYNHYICMFIHMSHVCLVVQSCPTTCDPMDGSPPGSSVHGDSPDQNTGMGCHALLQGISLTQGSNPVLPHCKRFLYHLSHQGSPGNYIYYIITICMFVHLIYIYMYIYIHICIWVSKCVYMYVCIYVITYQPNFWFVATGRTLKF